MHHWLSLTNVRLLLVFATTAALMVAAACDGADQEMESEPVASPTVPDAPAPTSDTPTPTAGEPTTGEAPSEIEAAARRLLAEEVGEGSYTLISSEAMDWSDASLGCPQEGIRLRPGHHSRLQVGVRSRGCVSRGAYQRRRLSHGDLPGRTC